MTAVDSYKNDAICRAVRKLVDAGVVVVAAASGNNGKSSAGQQTLRPRSFTRYRAFSDHRRREQYLWNQWPRRRRDRQLTARVVRRAASGPTLPASSTFDNLIKPDLVAPGNKIVSAESTNCLLVTQHPESARVSRRTAESQRDVHERHLDGDAGCRRQPPL